LVVADASLTSQSVSKVFKRPSDTNPHVQTDVQTDQHTEPIILIYACPYALTIIAATWNNCRRLVVDANFEASRAPVNELDGPLGLDGGDGGVDVFGHDVTAVQHAARHVLAVAGVALHHLTRTMRLLR
jgi:hypothetical protein